MGRGRVFLDGEVLRDVRLDGGITREFSDFGERTVTGTALRIGEAVEA